MALTTVEKNRRKRERKKKASEKQKDFGIEPASKSQIQSVAPPVVADEDDLQNDVEIVYVAPEIPSVVSEEGVNDALIALRRFQSRAAAAVASSDELQGEPSKSLMGADNDDRNEVDGKTESWSKRKLRDMVRPSVAELKRLVQRPDLVEAHDVTAPDPEFLIRLKAVPGSVSVPRHWGRKRKYLQGKRGFEKPPFQLPAFLVNTGITVLRDTIIEAESEKSAKQKNRSRVQVKLGAIDVDYRTLHDAFFKYQTKPSGLTRFGDLYYEGKELEVGRKIRAGRPLSAALRAALGITSPTSPPPWLINMQRYGPPPSYPSMKIPGLNAPLPDPACQYGYHPQGWGKPPIDHYGRPLYGGNPFDPPGSSAYDESTQFGDLVTSDGKTISNADWGALPTGYAQQDQQEDDDDESSGEEKMEESSEEEEIAEDGMESTLPPPYLPSNTAPVDLRKTGLDTPMSAAVVAAGPPKQLYRVIEQKQAAAGGDAVFASGIAYAVPTASKAPEGAESVLSKAVPAKETKRKTTDDDDDEELGKNFKF